MRKMSGNEKITVESMNLHYGKFHALKNINMAIPEKEITAFIGPSGCGKSTFLRSLNLLEEPTGGKILFEGTDITDSKVDINRHRQKIGMVFQQFNLFPHKTVKENIMLAPVTLNLMSKEEAEKTALELLERVGLPDKADSYPDMLSGGQKQRVAIARAIVNNPRLLLADEPTGALDTKSGEQVMEIFRELNSEGVTIVMITHEREIAEHARRIMTIRDGEIYNDSNGGGVK